MKLRWRVLTREQLESGDVRGAVTVFLEENTMAVENIPCVHDYLDPNTTVVVRAVERECWCISCGKSRKLAPLNDASRQAALAAKDHMLFGGGSRGDN